MPALPDIYKNTAVGKGLLVFGLAAFAFLVFSALYMFEHHTDSDRSLSLILGSLWVVGPPIWFFIEHVYFFKKFGDPQQYDQFKRAQDLASKIWAAGILILAAIWSGGFPK